MATVSCDRLWKMFIDRDMSKTEVIQKADISTGAMAHLGKNEDICAVVLVKICVALDCTIDNIMEIIPDKETVVNG